MAYSSPNPAEMDPRIPVDSKLNLRQQGAFAAKEANCSLGCIRRSVARRVREVILPLHLTLVRPHLQYCVQCFPGQERHRHMGVSTARTTRIVSGLMHKMYAKMLKDLSLFIFLR